MASFRLKHLVSPRAASFAVIQGMREALGGALCVVDAAGQPLLGEPGGDEAAARVPIVSGGVTLGFVVGPAGGAQALASLLEHLVVRESESRAFAGEVLQLYRELHVIERLSDELAPLIDLPGISQAALAQAQRLIPATHGGIFVSSAADGRLEATASFAHGSPWQPDERLTASILERDVAEIINDCAADLRVTSGEREICALICAPLRAAQRSMGVIALASTQPGTAYTAANLKLMNTIALQTAAAIENAFLCARMIETASQHAALEAELQAASAVQQMLLQSASRATPGFQVESVYLPASEVGGDFFLVSPALDGSLLAIVGDVSGKGLTAAMRVAMILGALRRDLSHDPGTILARLNNILIGLEPFGFTTACCVRISLDGEYSLANAGHIPPYLSGREVATPDSLPLGIVSDQVYELVSGRLSREDRLVLMSDGIPEARSQAGDLLGFERLSELTLLSAGQIADTAKEFGQEDDITVLRLGLA